MQRARAAKGHQHETARIDASLDREHAQRAQHLALGHAHDPFGALLHLHAQRRCQARHRGDGERAIQRQVSRQRSVLEQAPQHQVRVGDRRLLAAASVAGRPRHRPRRRRPHTQRTARVAPGDRAAPRPDCVDIQCRKRQRSSRDHAFGRLGDLCAFDHAGVAGGAAHVEAEHVALARELGEQQCAAHSAGRPREDRQGCVCAGAGRLGEPARGLHHERLRQAACARLPREPAQVGVEQRR